ncbi:hypothetical protein E2562_006890 [Oryza meyeriana var. granulata]|uniref:Uncharacterized protein n=1 Tax=Oryza meyeriana var. granulata TaxID=110450 RepID=A0A6G1BJ66_9ORYZ|nr:hypothetical protein E2562_006890 [Oryza meyeriana var. granulata]
MEYSHSMLNYYLDKHMPPLLERAELVDEVESTLPCRGECGSHQGRGGHGGRRGHGACGGKLNVTEQPPPPPESMEVEEGAESTPSRGSCRGQGGRGGH